MTMIKKLIAAVVAITLVMTLGGCNKQNVSPEPDNKDSQENTNTQETENQNTEKQETEKQETETPAITPVENSALDVTDMFTKRDLKQTADTSDAKTITVSDGATTVIDTEGVYVLTGTAKNAQILVKADENAKVQLVLDGLNVTNDSTAVVYVETSDKVFITTASDSRLVVSNDFTDDSGAVICSKEDLVLNGTATLTVESPKNGIVGKDDLKITGGTYKIKADNHAIKANDSLLIYDGELNLNAGKDGLHCENDEDDTKGIIYVYNGTLTINADSDGVEAAAILQIDGGKMTVDAGEGLEATHVQINGGDISIKASDDGINASEKSQSYSVVIEINGGNISIDMGQGDTDAIDANGDLIITGGNINITAQFAFDYDRNVTFTSGKITVNGQEVTEITNSMMGPGGGFGGGPGGQGPGGPGGGGR